MLLKSGIALISIGAVGIIVAVCLEVITAEPVYMIVMKVAAGFFGVGGPVLGWAIVRRSSGKGKQGR